MTGDMAADAWRVARARQDLINKQKVEIQKCNEEIGLMKTELYEFSNRLTHELMTTGQEDEAGRWLDKLEQIMFRNKRWPRTVGPNEVTYRD